MLLQYTAKPPHYCVMGLLCHFVVACIGTTRQATVVRTIMASVDSYIAIGQKCGEVSASLLTAVCARSKFSILLGARVTTCGSLGALRSQSASAELAATNSEVGIDSDIHSVGPLVRSWNACPWACGISEQGDRHTPRTTTSGPGCTRNDRKVRSEPIRRIVYGGHSLARGRAKHRPAQRA